MTETTDEITELSPGADGPITKLPVELAHIVFSYLERKNLASALQTCRGFRPIAEEHLYANVQHSWLLVRTILRRPQLGHLVKRYSYKFLRRPGEEIPLERWDVATEAVLAVKAFLEMDGSKSAVGYLVTSPFALNSLGTWRACEVAFMVLQFPNLRTLDTSQETHEHPTQILWQAKDVSDTPLYPSLKQQLLGKLKEVGLNFSVMMSEEYVLLYPLLCRLSSLENIVVSDSLWPPLWDRAPHVLLPAAIKRLALNWISVPLDRVEVMVRSAPNLTDFTWRCKRSDIQDPDYLDATRVGTILRSCPRIVRLEVQCAGSPLVLEQSEIGSAETGHKWGMSGRIGRLGSLEHLEELTVATCLLFGWDADAAEDGVDKGWLPPSIRKLQLTAALHHWPSYRYGCGTDFVKRCQRLVERSSALRPGHFEESRGEQWGAQQLTWTQWGTRGASSGDADAQKE